jgi:2-polyprenyl-3-methyl-5-hydroxy-6-metoxy-1,4-benzoquinol methylase
MAVEALLSWSRLTRRKLWVSAASKTMAILKSIATPATVRQQRFYEEECDPEFEIVRPHGCGKLYRYLIEQKFQTGCDVLGLALAGKTLLEICAGSGMMTEKFARAGAFVTATDFSTAAIIRARERARRYGFTITLAVADAEKLPFSDRSFDIAVVHDGLHHLENPQQAIREMARIAGEGVLIMDPAKAAFTRVAVRLGIAQDVEDAGNEVKRLKPPSVGQILCDCGLIQIKWRRTLMYYPHHPGPWCRLLDAPVLFLSSRLMFKAINFVFGRWGNKLALSAVRSGAHISRNVLKSIEQSPFPRHRLRFR